MSEDIELGNNTFRIGRLTARQQFHVVRRLTPILRHLMPYMVNGGLSGLTFADGVAALSETVREISDLDCDYVLDTCLAVVRWKSGDRFGPLRAPNGAYMLGVVGEDLALQLRLAWEVLADNLANFSFATLVPTGWMEETPTTDEELAA